LDDKTSACPHVVMGHVIIMGSYFRLL